MTREPNKNPAASIRAKLLSLSREKGEDYQRVLGRFAIERFLYRLGISTYRDRFVLKGATLFTLWTGETHRPTKDLDLLGWGSPAIADVELQAVDTAVTAWRTEAQRFGISKAEQELMAGAFGE